MRNIARASVIAMGLSSFTTGCTVDEVPDGIKRTPPGSGPTIRFDLYHKPLPDIPLPNDTAMWPDPTSRTGLRVNASLVAPTNIEREARRKFDSLEGWGTYAPITIGFDKKPADRAQHLARAAIDLGNIVKRHQGDDYEFDNDAIYVVNLTTGVPALLDLGEGAFQYAIREKGKYWRNDTRRLEQNLMWDTADETVDPVTGVFDGGRTFDGTRATLPIYKPEWDTDFDGVIDTPNLLDPQKCPNQAQVTGGSDEVARDRCVTDELLTWYERETDTLIMRPLIPLDERTQYAVVVMDRTTDPDGEPVKSPFDFVYHPSQEQAMEKLQAHLSNPSLAKYYGDIGGSGFAHVAFAWSFTTQPVTEDLREIRDGLYGTGPLASLSTRFPAEVELGRAAGVVDLEALADGAEEPDDWQSDPQCQTSAGGSKADHQYIVEFDAIKSTLRSLAGQAFGFEGPTLDGLLSSFDSISHIATGTVKSPFFISGGPQGTDPNASFELDFRTGEGPIHEDQVQFLLTIPKEGKFKQPFPVAYYGHGYTSSTLESLGFAGWLASHGIASIGVNATFHGLEIGETELKLAKALFSGACYAPFSSGLFAGRSRDLDGDLAPNSGGDYWTSYLFHTRDVVRQSAVDLLQVFRALKSFDGQIKTTQDYDGNPATEDLAGDFDGNGVPDVGGPTTEYYAWGQSLGGILAPFLAALDPGVVAAVPGSGAAGLLDVGARTFQGGAFEGIYLRNFGPLVVGVPAKDYYDENHQTTSTACKENEVSLRFVVVDVNDDRELEFNCLDVNSLTEGAGLPSGGTVLVTNGANGEKRCARMDADGRFRIGIPSSVGDRLELQVWDKPDIVDTYDGALGCNIDGSEGKRLALINEWGNGLVKAGSLDPFDPDKTEPVCTEERGCTRFDDKYFPAGAKLTSVVEGFGHIRQTPSLRRFMNLASSIVDPGDPVNYLPYLALKPMLDPWGKPQPPTGLLNFVTIGDMNVPLNSGIAIGRVSGAVPFLRPDAAERYPEYMDYATPAELYEKLGDKTPNRVLIESHVMEGVNRLERWPVDSASCGRNEVPVTGDLTCHPNCTDTDTSACLSGQECVSGRCVARAWSDSDCRQFLFDPDVIDESSALYGEAESAVPLRVGRIAMPASMSSLDAVWAPRLMGAPGAKDSAGWTANQRVIAHLNAYIEPKGVHGFEPNNPCQNFQTGLYMINLIGRFFRSGGADVYYLSHPETHLCLGRAPGQGGCAWLVPPK